MRFNSREISILAIIPIILSIGIFSAIPFSEGEGYSQICIDKVWIESTKGRIACVTPSTAEKLVERGWGTLLEEIPMEKPIEEEKQQMPPISNSDDVKIRELIFDYQSMLNNEEIEKIPRLYSEKAIFMPPDIPAIKGVEEIGLTYEYLFSQFDFELEFVIKEVVTSENFAYVISNSEGTITLKEGEIEESSKNQEIFILLKEGDSWKISRYIFNSWS